VYKDRNITRTLEQAGFNAIVLTVDTPQKWVRNLKYMKRQPMIYIVAYNLLLYWQILPLTSFIMCRFTLPPHVKYRDLEGLMNLEKMDNGEDRQGEVHSILSNCTASKCSLTLFTTHVEVVQ
jgi:hypothetical protein